MISLAETVFGGTSQDVRVAVGCCLADGLGLGVVSDAVLSKHVTPAPAVDGSPPTISVSLLG